MTTQSTPSPNPTHLGQDDELELAFRVLATFPCSNCRRPLTKESHDSKPHWRRRTPEQTDPHICCGIAHCPYCGKPASERCRHLVSFKEYGRWSVPGFRGKTARTLPTLAPAHGVPNSQLLDFEDDQKEQAFRTAAPFLNLLYTEGFASKSDIKVPLAPILGPHFFRGDRCMEVNSYGRNHYYHFSKDPDRVRAQALQIFKDLEEGIVRMNNMTPCAARFLLREIEPPVNQYSYVSSIQFSPDGRLLFIGLPEEGQLWDVETGALLHRLPMKHSYNKRVTASFSQDSTRLALASSDQENGHYSSGSGGHKTVAETTIFDIKSGEIIGKVPAVDLKTRITGVTTDSLLAQGTVLARARGRFVYLNPIGKEGEAILGSSRTIRLPHRTVLRLCAFSPDSRTFATLQESYTENKGISHHILVWRLP
ncbi:MAG: hypothetical protein NTX57_09950 [Armatimonadetes bacterium]|nr:hypothetical protein [Armatimonadota bacterium]